MDPARMSAAGLPMDKFARMLDKYKEVSTASRLLMQMRGGGGKFPTKKQVEAAAKAGAISKLTHRLTHELERRLLSNSYNA